jgi:CRP-like cAMP-binding protein
MFLVVEGAVVVRAGPHSPAPAEKSDQRGSQPAQGGDVQSLNVGAVDLAAGERIVGKGDIFGEGGLFPEDLGSLRLESARTLSFVSAYILTAASMREIKAEYPAVRCLCCMMFKPL